MEEALDLDAIQTAWNSYFVLIGVEQVKNGDEHKAVADAIKQRESAETELTKEIASGQRTFDNAKKRAEGKHAERLNEIEGVLQGVRSIAQKAAQATKDHQDKDEKELGVRPNIPQAAPPAMRRTGI